MAETAPVRTPLVDLTTGRVTPAWLNYFSELGTAAADDTTSTTSTRVTETTVVNEPVPSFTGSSALTSADDTNVTMTLGGLPAIALNYPVSMTLGWTGTLAAGRLNANVVQSITNDTNVTGVIAAQNLTLGWTGTLAVGRGGTGTGTTFTAGSIVFAGPGGVYAQDNTKLFWNDALNRLGIGTNTPAYTLEVAGDALFSAASDRELTVYATSNNTQAIIVVIGTTGGGSPIIGSFGAIDTGPSVRFSSESFGVPLTFETVGGEAMRITPDLKVGIGTTGPTAMLHIKAGTATANTAPLKFTSGTLLTSPEAGAIEFLTDKFYGTITTGSARHSFATEQRDNVFTGNNSFNGSTSFGGTAINLNNIITAASNLIDPALDSISAYFSRTMVLTAANAAVVTGFFGNVSLSANAFNQTGVVRGSYSQVASANTATVTNAYGADNLIYNTGTGTITNGIATQSIIQNLNAAGVITNAYCVSASLGFNLGTITNTYGFYVGDITAGTQTNTPYSFYASDLGALNYFGGTVVLGSLLTLKGYTVATLPAGAVGQCAYCTDLLAPAFLTAVVGGGAVKGPVFYNGAAWVAF